MEWKTLHTYCFLQEHITSLIIHYTDISNTMATCMSKWFVSPSHLFLKKFPLIPRILRYLEVLKQSYLVWDTCNKVWLYRYVIFFYLLIWWKLWPYCTISKYMYWLNKQQTTVSYACLSKWETFILKHFQEIQRTIYCIVTNVHVPFKLE